MLLSNAPLLINRKVPKLRKKLSSIKFRWFIIEKHPNLNWMGVFTSFQMFGNTCCEWESINTQGELISLQQSICSVRFLWFIGLDVASHNWFNMDMIRTGCCVVWTGPVLYGMSVYYFLCLKIVWGLFVNNSRIKIFTQLVRSFPWMFENNINVGFIVSFHYRQFHCQY